MEKERTMEIAGSVDRGSDEHAYDGGMVSSL